MYPKIKEYISTPTAEMWDKVEEELLEVLVYYHCHTEKKEYTRYRELIIENLIAELHDFIQVIYTFSYITHIDLCNERMIMRNLSIDKLIVVLTCKVEYIVEKQPNALRSEFGACIDLAYSILLMLCIDNEIDVEETTRKHIRKMYGRNVTVL